MKILTDFWDFVDNRIVIRRGMMLVTLSVTIDTLLWAREFAQASERPGADIALIVGAIFGPLALLHGWVLNLYNAGRVGK